MFYLRKAKEILRIAEQAAVFGNPSRVSSKLEGERADSRKVDVWEWKGAFAQELVRFDKGILRN